MSSHTLSASSTLVAKLLLGAALIAGTMASAHAAEVKGTNVSRVQCKNGDAVKSTFRLNVGTSTWTEDAGVDGHFKWTERARDEWSVYLTDASRGYNLQLDLWTKNVTLSDQSTTLGVLCTVSDSSTYARTTGGVNGRAVFGTSSR